MAKKSQQSKKSVPRPRATRAQLRPSKAPTHAETKALSHCEEMYIRALADPFDPEIQGEVCYPSFPAKKSVKFTGTATVNVTIGTGGVGWIAYDPNPASNSTASIAYTDATYAGTTASAITSTAGSGVNNTSFGTPTTGGTFDESTTGGGNQFRMVVAGAKFRYTGTELNRGGSAFAVTAPQQDSLIGFLLGSAATPTQSREHAVTMDYQTVVLPPSHEEDVEWKDGDQIFPWSDGGGTSPNYLQAIIFFGTAGNTFVVRLIEHYEVTGTSYNMFASMSHIGEAQLIQSVSAASASATYGAPSQGVSYMQQFARGLSRIADSPIVKRGANFLLRLAGRYVEQRLTRGASRRAQPLRLGYAYEEVD